MTSKSDIKKVCLTNYLNQLSGFVEDLLIICPSDQDLAKAKTYISTMSTMNPKALLQLWHTSISLKYNEEIEKGDITFAIKKDYTDDVKATGAEDEEYFLQIIVKVKGILQTLDKDQINIIFKYLKNITKLTILYNQ